MRNFKCMCVFMLVFSLQEGLANTIEEVVVVGSHIKGVDIAGTLPVTQLSAEDISDTGALDGDELLRSIPQIGAVGFTAERGGTTGVNAARGDVGSVNLRSIGEGNTLVLLNGRRMVLHPITQNSSVDLVPVVSVNSNTLPVAGLERVEVLRDGAGALYGADAVAGVLNYVIQKDYQGGELNVKWGTEEGSSRNDLYVSGAKGFEFNNGATYLTVTGGYVRKKGILANENEFSRNQDLRSLVPAEFARDASLDNRSSLEVFPQVNFTGLGTFHLRPATLVRDNGNVLTLADCGGRGLTGVASVFNDGVENLCLDASGQDRAIRPNRNEVRTLTPDVQRANFFAYLSHALDGGLEVYGEGSFYYSEVKRQWEQAGILSNGRFFVPADYYWNPLGPVTFGDGRANPNRLPGLDSDVVPLTGLGFEVRSLRPVDVGTRNIEIEGSSYRILGGLKGNWGNWDWDTAALYSRAEVDDVASNRISTPLLQAQLRLDTPAAYNIFTGANPDDPSSVIDQTVNPRANIDPFIVSATRNSVTTLAQVDFKISNSTFYALPAGDVAFGTGFEWRYEKLNEDNSAIFDGSQPYIDPLDASLLPGETTNLSSLQGSSVRPDVSASRSVISLYGELIIPLLNDLPAIRSLNMQVAARYEDFSDVGNIIRPKVALSWYPLDQVQFRGAYSQGFRAPNLIQLNSRATSITVGVQDYAEGILLGTGDLNRGPSNGNYILETFGNNALDSETSKNISLGIVLTPTEETTLTADWWRIETVDTVGVFTDENESRLDAVLRSQGSSNPNVFRAPPDAANPLGEILRITRSYENRDKRVVKGLDLGIQYSLDTDIGGFGLKVNAARLLAFDQEAVGNAALLVSAGANESVLGASVGSLIEREFFPKWRGTASVRWKSKNNRWGAGMFIKYIGKVFEPTVTNTAGDELFVRSQIRANAYAVHRGLLGKGSSIRLGINNLFDKNPPFADESFGYEGELHSNRGRYFYLSAKYRF